MYFGKIKIGNSILVLIVLYFLGFTHFLGGPYGLAKFLFIAFLVLFLFFILFILGMISFLKNIFGKQKRAFNTKIEEKGETIKVDAQIIE